MEVNELKWIESTPKKVRLFRLGDEPYIFYVIPYREVYDEYMVLHDDAFEHRSGQVEFLTGGQIFEKYGINLTVENDG